MLKLIPLTAMVTIVFLFGSSDIDAGEPDHNSHHDHGVSITEELSVPLMADEQWQMDSHTRDTFKQMVKRFDELDPPNATEDQLTELGKTLDGDLNELIAGCTMTGDAHNALHKYLMNYMPAVNDLKTEGSLEKAKKVHELLNSYPKYFK